MLLTYNALKNKLPALNTYDYTEKDILRILGKNRVYYVETNLPDDVLGMYIARTIKQEYILINLKVTGGEKLRTQAHETIHHLIDYPIDEKTVRYFRTLEVINKRQDINAEILSLIMMFSFPTLERYIKARELPEYLLPYLNERLEILDKHGV